MTRTLQILFIGVLALLVGHELDAMTHAEWRMLPGFSSLPDATARPWFVLLHIPLVGLLIERTTHHHSETRRRWQLGVDVFVVGHAMAHALLSGHVHYTFTAPVETITVFGAGLVAGVHLALTLAHGRRSGDEA